MTRSTGKPKLEPLDKAGIRAEAEKYVEDALKNLAGAEQVATVAAGLVERSKDAANSLRAKRDDAALHLTIRDRRRGVPAAMGMNASYVWRMKNAVDARRVPLVENAEAQLVSTSQAVAFNEEVIRLATPVRDKAMRDLTAAGWTSEQIAEITGLTGGRVRQVNLKKPDLVA